MLFLTGVNVGFSSLGTVLGAELTSGWTDYWLIPLAMLLGWFIISAEPAVYVLEKQIEEVSEGMIPGKAIKLSLSIAIAIAMGLSLLRVLTGISILWFLVPGYALALGMTFFVPDIYTAIAFDSGGVASGPMPAPEGIALRSRIRAPFSIPAAFCSARAALITRLFSSKGTGAAQASPSPASVRKPCPASSSVSRSLSSSQRVSASRTDCISISI